MIKLVLLLLFFAVWWAWAFSAENTPPMSTACAGGRSVGPADRLRLRNFLLFRCSLRGIRRTSSVGVYGIAATWAGIGNAVLGFSSGLGCPGAAEPVL